MTRFLAPSGFISHEVPAQHCVPPTTLLSHNNASKKRLIYLNAQARYGCERNCMEGVPCGPTKNSLTSP
jgi:hypothetical protein